jgi:hypothetical protein
MYDEVLGAPRAAERGAEKALRKGLWWGASDRPLCQAPAAMAHHRGSSVERRRPARDRANSHTPHLVGLTLIGIRTLLDEAQGGEGLLLGAAREDQPRRPRACPRIGARPGAQGEYEPWRAWSILWGAPSI